MMAADALGSDVALIVQEIVTGRDLVVELATFPARTRLREIKALVAGEGRRVRLMVR